MKRHRSLRLGEKIKIKNLLDPLKVVRYSITYERYTLLTKDGFRFTLSLEWFNDNRHIWRVVS